MLLRNSNGFHTLTFTTRENVTVFINEITNKSETQVKISVYNYLLK